MWIEVRKQVENWINFYVILHVRMWIEVEGVISKETIIASSSM